MFLNRFVISACVVIVLLSIYLCECASTYIDPAAWWADMNYYLSVVPYLGAVEAGLAPKIAVRRNPDAQVQHAIRTQS